MKLHTKAAVGEKRIEIWKSSKESFCLAKDSLRGVNRKEVGKAFACFEYKWFYGYMKLISPRRCKKRPIKCGSII